MISLVCIYNNEEILHRLLLKSLKNQKDEFELILLDNRSGEYPSAAAALNIGGVKAKGDFIAFAHQDMWLGGDFWFSEVETLMKSLPNAGVAGVAGTEENGKNKYSLDVISEWWWVDIDRVKKPEEVLTLDECLLIIPKPVFVKLTFDNIQFDGWDCYGLDYSLSVRKLGLKVYVIPISSAHCCIRGKVPIWELKNLFKYQKRLYQKHKKSHKKISNWVSEISLNNLIKFRLQLLIWPIYSKLFPELTTLLKNELAGCQSVLDLGCGSFSPLYFCSPEHSVGVELFEPSLRMGFRLGTHDRFVQADVRNIEFTPDSFDAVIAVDLFQHLTFQEGVDLIKKMEKWARKKIVIVTANGLSIAKPLNGNPLTKIQSGWEIEKLRSHGLKVRGVVGWKGFKELKECQRTIRINFFRARINNLTQKLVFHYPRLALKLLVTKQIGQNQSLK